MAYTYNNLPTMYYQQVILFLVIFALVVNFIIHGLRVENTVHSKRSALSYSRAVSFHESSDQRCSALKFSVNDTRRDLKFARGRHDNKRLVRIYDFYYVGTEWDALISQYNVCFATQTSLERIYWLPKILDKWTGPLSAAIYITSQTEWEQATLHVAVPTNITSSITISKQLLKQWNFTDLQLVFKKSESCPEPVPYLKYLMEVFPTLNQDELKLKEFYPQNHMRNIARKACGTHWTYSADVDIIPRNGMADMLQEFYANIDTSDCSKCAYVIPTFELSESYSFPESKKEMVDLIKVGAARQFHGMFFKPGHFATNNERWVSRNLEDGPTKVIHRILESNTTMYEPFYISADDIPPFDERFVGYGFSRNSQFAAAHQAGWVFYVLSPVFSIHWGLQTNETLLSSKKDGVGRNVRREQTNENEKLFKRIEWEYRLKAQLNLF